MEWKQSEEKKIIPIVISTRQNFKVELYDKMIEWVIETKKVICKIKSKLQDEAATKEMRKTSSVGRGNSAKALGQKQILGKMSP